MYFFHALTLLVAYSRHFNGEHVLNYSSSWLDSYPTLLRNTEEHPNRERDTYSLTMKKIGDTSHGGIQIPMYHLFAEGIPSKRKFQIVARSMLGEKTILFQGEDSQQGVIRDQFGYSSPFQLIRGDYFQRGEVSQLLLMDQEHWETNSVSYLPYPIEPLDLHSLKVSLYYLSKVPEIYLFGLENLAPGEKVRTLLKNGLISKESMCIGSKAGKAASFVAWANKNAPKGEGSFEIFRKKRVLEYKFSWDRQEDPLPFPLIIFTMRSSLSEADLAEAKVRYFEHFFQGKDSLA